MTSGFADALGHLHVRLALQLKALGISIGLANLTDAKILISDTKSELVSVFRLYIRVICSEIMSSFRFYYINSLAFR